MFPYVSFDYDKIGRGELKVFDNNLPIFVINARTGSIDKSGKLKNEIKIGNWYLMTNSIDTLENAMIIPPERIGWKIRLFDNEKKYTNYLIHPDGNLPGSLGCIVTPNMAHDLRKLLDELLTKDTEIPVFINRKEGD